MQTSLSGLEDLARFEPNIEVFGRLALVIGKIVDYLTEGSEIEGDPPIAVRVPYLW